ncbi:DMT family transporter [Crossiella cryophila]
MHVTTVVEIRPRRALAVSATVLAGVGLAGQARMNGEFGARLGNGFAASLLTTAGGLLVLLAVVPALPAGRRGIRKLREAVRDGGLRWWHCAGGIAGALIVGGQGVTVTSLGVAVFTVAIVAGTVTGSLAADRWGLGPGGVQPVTTARLGGALLCVLAVAVAGLDRFGDTSTLVLVALPLVAGAAGAVQSAFNGRVAAAAGSPWPATTLNFLVATLTLGLLLAVQVAVQGWPGRPFPAEPWFYLAGMIGIAVVAVATLAVREIGVLVYGLASVAGQLLGAVVLDAVTPGPAPTLATWAGAALTLIAVLLAARTRRVSPAPVPPRSTRR